MAVIIGDWPFYDGLLRVTFIEKHGYILASISNCQATLWDLEGAGAFIRPLTFVCLSLFPNNMSTLKSRFLFTSV